MPFHKVQNLKLFMCLVGLNGYCHAEPTSRENETPVQFVQVWGSADPNNRADDMSPKSVLTQKNIAAINVATTEDILKYEPSLVIRRRFIGDSNGTLGVRGSNMFQTSRSMVFADGVPLHYLLQSRWSGAPRWTMVSASEIAQVEVVYGPFSAEYSGNAMGGVVIIETAIPQKREVHVDGSFFSQDFSAYGYDDSVTGFKGFASYGNKIGDNSIYVSYNHLDNTAQPQTFRDTEHEPATSGTLDTVRGGIFENDARGNPKLWFGDTGVVDTITDNLKFKFGRDFGQWQSLLNIAYEDRSSTSDSANSYIEDYNGNTLWSGSGQTQDGRLFSFSSSRLNVSELERQSLSIGWRLKGELSDNAVLEANINRFSILEDQTRASKRNPKDSAYTLDGQISDFDNSGWQTAEVKLSLNDVLTQGVDVITGLRYETFELNLDVYDSPDYAAGLKGEYTSRFGGETEIAAAFLQSKWAISSRWDAALGLRFEHFISRNGYYDDDDSNTSELDITDIPTESLNSFSPKFALGYQANDSWLLRYSLAKAFRFPIVEELFSQYEAYNTVALSNPELEPEQGLHHNIMLDRTIDGGYVRINIFQENVEQAIESQTDSRTNVRTFVPIDETEVTGVEVIANKDGFFSDRLDLRVNATWTDATILNNSTAEGSNSDSIEGNAYPRMPKWRANLLTIFHLNSDWDLSANLQYASESFGRIENDDTQKNVYGAQDGYTRIGLKAAFSVNTEWQLSLGLDNITDEVAYVAHPWPGRTMYLNFTYTLND